MGEPRLWVVEMFLKNKWLPTVGVGLTRLSAGWELREFRLQNPDDKFRLKPYFRPAKYGRVGK